MSDVCVNIIAALAYHSIIPLYQGLSIILQFYVINSEICMSNILI